MGRVRVEVGAKGAALLGTELQAAELRLRHLVRVRARVRAGVRLGVGVGVGVRVRVRVRVRARVRGHPGRSLAGVARAPSAQASELLVAPS